MFSVPILLLTYKKRTALEVLKAINKVNPKKLYIAQNAPKNTEEEVVCSNLKKDIQNLLKPECDVVWILKDTHLSCKESISSSIDYFFSNEEMGIIFDDDCVPNKSFFYFAEEMLEKYKNSPQVFMISGWSPLDLDPIFKSSIQTDYLFSKYNHIWGWATWRHNWIKYQKDFFDFEMEFNALDIFSSSQERGYWYKVMKAYSQGKIDTWDFPFTYTMWKHKALSVFPKNNMISNIGFNNPEAVHTKQKSKFENLKTYSLSFPLIHPEKIETNLLLDQKDFEISFKLPSLFIRVINKFSRYISGSNIFRV